MTDSDQERLAEIMYLIGEYKHVRRGVQLSLYYRNDWRWGCGLLVSGNVVVHTTLDNEDGYHAICEFLKDETS